MLYTVQNLIDYDVAKYVDGGVCATDKDGNVNAALLRYINMASNILWNEGLYSEQEDMLCIQLHNCCACLPRGYETISAARVGDSKMKIRNRHYEFASAGPGLASEGCCQGNCCGPNDIIDRGNSSTHAPLGGCKHLYAISDRMEDGEDIKIHVSGIDCEGREVHTCCGEGEKIPIANNNCDGPEAPVLSDTLFAEVTRVSKPITCGYVRLFSYDPVTGARAEIASYHPKDRNPCYRCYHFPGASDCCQVTVLARRRWMPVFHLTDPLPIPDLIAYRYMIQALAAEETMDLESLNAAERFKNKARKHQEAAMKRWKGLHEGRRLHFEMRGSPNHVTSTPRQRGSGRAYNAFSRRGRRR